MQQKNEWTQHRILIASFALRQNKNKVQNTL